MLWFTNERHKFKPRYFSVADVGNITRRESFKTASGYRIEAGFAGDEVHTLEVHSPRYRWRQEPELVTCAVCGDQWLKGDPESSALHRREHKKRLAILEPSPDPRFLEALAHDPDPELVTSKSPKWQQQAMYERAVMFRREFHYDFVQWGYDGDDDPKVHGFLFNDDSGVFGHGAIAGACPFAGASGRTARRAGGCSGFGWRLRSGGTASCPGAGRCSASVSAIS